MLSRVSQRALRCPSGNVWTHFTPLAARHNAVNLGQGFPAFAPPELLRGALRRAERAGVVQYTRSGGHPRLVEAVAAHLGRGALGRPVDAERELLVTVGATEALLLAALATLDPGDEAMLLEPFYDSYAEQVALAGATCRFVPLDVGAGDAASWMLPFERMQAALTPQTKLLFFNNPANVPGKVYTRAELAQLAEFCVRNDLLVVSDEVYDVLTFDGTEHVRLASLPGMAERTITVCSAGKMFSATGFKIGWTVAPPDLTEAMASIHQYIPFCVSSTLQEAVADALEHAPEENYFDKMRTMFDAKRRKLLGMLDDVGLPAITPQGGYFALSDVSHIDPARYANIVPREGPAVADDWQFATWLTQEVGVCSIPISPFFREPAAVPGVYTRFAFCKTDEMIEQAGERLQKAKLH